LEDFLLPPDFNTDDIQYHDLPSDEPDLCQPIEWKEINFEKYWPTTKLIRCQYFGTCNAGQQMVNPCAHVAAFFWLIAWIMAGILDKKLEENERDKYLLHPPTQDNRVIDNTPAMQWFDDLEKKYQKEQQQLYCICNKPAHGRYFGPCSCCDMFYHAECLGLDEAKLIRDEEKKKPFYCNSWHPYYYFDRFWGKIEREKKYLEMYLAWEAEKKIWEDFGRGGKPKMDPKLKKWLIARTKTDKPPPDPAKNKVDYDPNDELNINETPKALFSIIFIYLLKTKTKTKTKTKNKNKNN